MPDVSDGAPPGYSQVVWMEARSGGDVHGVSPGRLREDDLSRAPSRHGLRPPSSGSRRDGGAFAQWRVSPGSRDDADGRVNGRSAAPLPLAPGAGTEDQTGCRVAPFCRGDRRTLPSPGERPRVHPAFS